jgi:hypothetical protein
VAQLWERKGEVLRYVVMICVVGVTFEPGWQGVHG